MKKIINFFKNKTVIAEIFLIIGILLMVLTTFLLNFYIGMYVLALIIFILGILIYKFY